MAYDDKVLIKLRRDYSKDEVVLHLINVVKESWTKKCSHDIRFSSKTIQRHT